jgi:hypothetical protein
LREEFMYQGKPVIGEAGDTRRGVMRTWCVLWEKESELFRDITVMQQPAAVRDEVLILYGFQGQREFSVQGRV